MIFTILMGFAVGASFGAAQPFVRTAAARLGVQIDAQIETLVTFALSLALLAVILRFLGVEAYPALMLIAAVLGVARKPLLARVTG